jgi:hypothetical protein
MPESVESMHIGHAFTEICRPWRCVFARGSSRVTTAFRATCRVTLRIRSVYREVSRCRGCDAASEIIWSRRLYSFPDETLVGIKSLMVRDVMPNGTVFCRAKSGKRPWAYNALKSSHAARAVAMLPQAWSLQRSACGTFLKVWHYLIREQAQRTHRLIV